MAGPTHESPDGCPGGEASFQAFRRRALEMQINTAGEKCAQCTRLLLPKGGIGLIPSVPHPRLCLLAQMEFASLKAEPRVRISDSAIETG